jgi:hypothetical protein
MGGKEDLLVSETPTKTCNIQKVLNPQYIGRIKQASSFQPSMVDANSIYIIADIATAFLVANARTHTMTSEVISSDAILAMFASEATPHWLSRFRAMKM